MTRILYSGKIPQSIIQNNNFQCSKFEHTLRFLSAEDVPAIIVLDLRENISLDITSAFREFFNHEQVPILGYLPENSLKANSLFVALGGNKSCANEAELSMTMQDLVKSERNFKNIEFPVHPGFSVRESSRRYLDILKKTNVWSRTAGLENENRELNQTIKELLQLLREICPFHLGLIIINNNQNAENYVLPDQSIYRAEYQDFMNFCLNDFYNHFPGLNIENINETIFLEDRTDFNKLGIASRKLSSYICLPLTDPENEIMGTLHLGHYNNNYFAGKILETIKIQARKMEFPLDYAIKTHKNKIRKDKIFNIFSRFVPPGIIPDLIEQETNRKNRSADKRKIAVLFSDIRSFTTLTEKNGAQTVVDFLNRHFDAMVSEIKKEGGTIDKFIGDAIVALFGVPDSFEDNAARAVRAARNMINKLSTVDVTGLILPEVGYNIGIGIHESEAIIGNIGSMDKSDFTAIGDVINIAEELEGLTKHYKHRILVSHSAYESSKNTAEWNIVVSPGTEDEFPLGLYSPKELNIKEKDFG